MRLKYISLYLHIAMNTKFIVVHVSLFHVVECFNFVLYTQCDSVAVYCACFAVYNIHQGLQCVHSPHDTLLQWILSQT